MKPMACALMILLLGIAPLQPANAAVSGSSGSVLVFGGSGQLGAEIVRALLADGREVVVFLRPTSDRSRLEGLKLRFVEGDVRLDADVRRALESEPFQIVINALGRSESDARLYETSGQSIARWAKATGVQQVILHSSVGVGKSRAAYPDRMFAERSSLFRYKKAAEDALIDSGLTYTIIRNAVLRDLPPTAPERARLSEDQLSFGVVSRRGLARLTRECIASAACANRIFHAADPGMAL